MNQTTTIEDYFSPSETLQLVCTLLDLGLLKISGKDAKKFLQGQLTCNLEELGPSRSMLGAHCNPQGRVISLFFIFERHDDYYLIMQKSMVDITLNALKKYAVFFKLQLTAASDELIVLGCSQQDLQKYDNISVIQIPTNSTRYILVGDKKELSVAWQLLSPSSKITSINTWKYLVLSDGIPTIYPETSGKFLPHEINLHKLNAISFDKGCYTGQEIIARMHYRAKLKNHMYRASLVSTLPQTIGADIYYRHDGESRTCGTIVDACQTVVNTHELLIITDETNIKNHHLFTENEIYLKFNQLA